MSDESALIPVFIPSLGAVLLSAEDKKGAPLTNEEAIKIRDNSPCIMMTVSDAATLAESRGYTDIDPENCWYDWQMLRRELGRKPDLEPGARVNLFDKDDPEYQATIGKARETINRFRDMLSRVDPNSALIKSAITDGKDRGFVWLFNTRTEGSGFMAEVFEVSPTVPNLTVGQTFRIPVEEVLDWMVNVEGKLHCGFSLRYHRERLPPHERDAFDAHIGVSEYV